MECLLPLEVREGMAKTQHRNSLFAETALLPDGWASGVRIETAGGRITGVEAGAKAAAGDERVAILIPGMPDVHSHAFQRGMA